MLSRVKRGDLKLTEAAELLELSYRQAKRPKKRYGEGGSKALMHGNVGRASNRANDKRREQVLELVRENYCGEPHERFGPTLASEHLATDHGLEVPRETLRRWMLAGWPVEPPSQTQAAPLAATAQSTLRRADPGRRLAPRLARRTRAERLHDELRRRCERSGAMPFLRTRKRLGQQPTCSEPGCVSTAFRRRCIATGKNVYLRQPTSREAIEGIEPETQFGRMCAKLGIAIIAASSPQAKGRVERHHGTHQDRLIKKMRLQGIADYEAANRYLDEQYLPEHNAKFGCEPSAGADFHRRLSKRLDFKWVFCLEAERVVSGDRVVRFENRFSVVETEAESSTGVRRESHRAASARGRVASGLRETAR